MLFEIPHCGEEHGRVTEPEHHAGQIALTRGCAWLAGQILLQDRVLLGNSVCSVSWGFAAGSGA